jgi:hypothetical protein
MTRPGALLALLQSRAVLAILWVAVMAMFLVMG